VLTSARQVTDSPLPHPRPPPIQACTHVHPRRSRRGLGPLAYAEHWPPDQDAVQGQSVHRGKSQGRHVPEREPHLPDPLPGGHERGAKSHRCGLEVIWLGDGLVGDTASWGGSRRQLWMRNGLAAAAGV